MITRCRYCGKAVDPWSRTSMQRVEGWERRAGIRASGKHGGSDVYFREQLDEFAHGRCVQLKRAGIDPGQGTLV